MRWRSCSVANAIPVHLAAKKFDTDLTPRKSAIKLVIQEELQKLADEADDEEDADDGAGKDEVAIDGTEVKAWR